MKNDSSSFKSYATVKGVYSVENLHAGAYHTSGWKAEIWTPQGQFQACKGRNGYILPIPQLVGSFSRGIDVLVIA